MAKSNTQAEINMRTRRERSRARWKVLGELCFVLLLSVATALLFFGSVTIQENSMSPTLTSGDRVYVNRVIYKALGIHRGDVIAYTNKSEVDSGIHVKRVIGLPGETVEIRDGLILIDGKTYIENKEFPNITKAGAAENGVKLASNEYFVLGDNRNNSEDSRFADVGNISKSNIIGKVWFIGKPFGHAGFVK